MENLKNGSYNRTQTTYDDRSHFPVFFILSNRTMVEKEDKDGEKVTCINDDDYQN